MEQIERTENSAPPLAPTTPSVPDAPNPRPRQRDPQSVSSSFKARTPIAFARVRRKRKGIRRAIRQ